MAFEQKIWLNVPDKSNPPDIPEGQDALARFDADNMNRIENGIKENAESSRKVNQYLIPWNLDENVGLINSSPATIGEIIVSYSGRTGTLTGRQIKKSHVVKAINSGLIRVKYIYALNGYYTGVSNGDKHPQPLVPENSYIKFYHNGNVIHSIEGFDTTKQSAHTYVPYPVCFDLEVKKGDEMYIELSMDASGSGDQYSYASAKLTSWNLYANIVTPFKYASLNETVDTVTPTVILNT